MEQPPLFLCERQKTSLTHVGCARMWLAARDPNKGTPKPWEGRAVCVTCPIGAAHAGQTISPVAESVALICKLCPRCLRVTERLINGKFCISCYNRDEEAKRGKNAKGGTPRLCSQLHEETIAISGGAAITVQSFPGVTCATEALIAATRTADTSLFFGWAAVGPGNIEGALL